jgi:hypothetical protein
MGFNSGLKGLKNTGFKEHQIINLLRVPTFLWPTLITLNLSLCFCNNIDHTDFSKFPSLKQGAQRISHKAYFSDTCEVTHILTVQHTSTLNTYNLLSQAITTVFMKGLF